MASQFLPEITSSIPAHNVFTFDNGVIFSSNFDNGNIARVERIPNRPYEFKVWSAYDNMGTPHQSKHCAWFHFMVTGLPMGCVLRIQIVNASNHSGLYKHDMRPVYRSNSTNQKWTRIKTSVRFMKESNDNNAQLFFEHSIDSDNDKLYFAFTYPYTYTQLQQELEQYDSLFDSKLHLNEDKSIYYRRELLTQSCDGRRIDLITITSPDGMMKDQYEPLLSGLFPDNMNSPELRPPLFQGKEVVFVSARVHSGEVPAQHTFKGIIQLLLDKDDLCGKALRSKYVFKLIPMLNPDGVYRGHFRMDQHGQNLNRYYTSPDLLLQPAIYAAKTLLDYYSNQHLLSLYLDFHAHASKRGCFIYGNVLDNLEDQIQNQLYCKLISLNTPHFDYEGCLFSKEHMFRTDPGDQAKGLTAEGSGRVNTYLSYGLIHSYTIECNYNTSRVGNEVPPPEQEIGGQFVTPASPFTTNPDKYTPNIYAGVGRACIIAMLDLRGQNPCSRISKSKYKTLDRIRNAVMMEVRSRKEYFGKKLDRERGRRGSGVGLVASASSGSEKRQGNLSSNSSPFLHHLNDDSNWRRVVEHHPNNEGNNNCNPPLSARSATSSSAERPHLSQQSNNQGHYVQPSEILFISARNESKSSKRRSTSVNTGIPLPTALDGRPVKSTIQESSNNGKYVLSAPTSPAKVSNHKKSFSMGSSDGNGGSTGNTPRIQKGESFDSNDSEYYYYNKKRDGGTSEKSENQSTKSEGNNSQFQILTPRSPRSNINNNNPSAGGRNQMKRSSNPSLGSPRNRTAEASAPSSAPHVTSHEPPVLQSGSQKVTRTSALQPNVNGSGGKLGGIAFIESGDPSLTAEEKATSSPLRLKGNYHTDNHEGETSPKSLPDTNGVLSPSSLGGMTNNSSQSHPTMTNNTDSNVSIHQNGTSMRDLIREHHLNKMIKLSNPMVPLGTYTKEGGGTNNSSANTSSNNSVNHSVSSNGRKHYKDNRKILGKTLHAAGVALLINGSSSSNLLPGNNHTNVGSTHSITSNDALALSLKEVHSKVATATNNSTVIVHRTPRKDPNNVIVLPGEVLNIPRPPSAQHRVSGVGGVDSPNRLMNDLIVTGNGRSGNSRSPTPNSVNVYNQNNEILEIIH